MLTSITGIDPGEMEGWDWLGDLVVMVASVGVSFNCLPLDKENSVAILTLTS